METEEKIHKRIEIEAIYPIVFRWICIVALSFLVLALCFGAVRLYDSSLNPISAVDRMIKILQIKRGNIFKTLFSFGVSIFYFIIIIFIIKNIVACFLSDIERSGTEKTKSKENVIKRIYASFYQSYLWAYILLAVVRWPANTPLNAAEGTFIAVGALVYLTNFIFSDFYVPKKEGEKTNLTDYIFPVIDEIILIALICCMAQFIISTGGNVIAILLWYFFFSLILCVFSGGSFPICGGSQVAINEESRGKYLKRILICSVIMGVVYCLFMSLFVYKIKNFDIDTLANWLTLIRYDHLPICLLSFAGLLLHLKKKIID